MSITIDQVHIQIWNKKCIQEFVAEFVCKLATVATAIEMGKLTLSLKIGCEGNTANTGIQG
jgi:hypothetical protein